MRTAPSCPKHFPALFSTFSSLRRSVPALARLSVAVCACWLLAGCGGGSAASGGPPPAAPVIGSFTASPAAINAGGSSSLSWTVTGATSVTLTGTSGQAVSPVSVSPGATTTYTLTASNATGSATATTTVTVNTVPVVASFSASPSSIGIGSSSSLSWTVTGATSVTLSGVNGQAVSPASVSPTATTTYTLTASNTAGSTTATTTVTVLPVIGSFTASQTSIAPGQPVTFTWTTTGATSLQLTGVAPTPTSPVTVYPATSGNYQLTASNSSGSVSQSIAITVSASTAIATATVGSTPGQLVPANFMGPGIGETSFENVFGEPATGTNPVLRQIIKNITQYGAAPITYKVTADDVDPSNGYVPTAAEISALSQLYKDLGVTFFIGVNLAADVPSVAFAQAQAFASGMPSGSLIGLEIGNEPDNYTHSSEQYRTAPYAFLSDYANFAPGVLSAIQNAGQPAVVKLVGPVWGEPATVTGGTSGIVNSSGNKIDLSDFLAAEGSNLALVTQHGYANQCLNGASYNTDFLLTPAAQNCVSTSYLLGGVAPAHAEGLPYRVGELNSITGGGVAGISNTYQAALWIIDLCSGLAKGGVDGVNIFGDSKTQYYTMFTFNTASSGGQTTYTLNYVTPQYYGVLMFQQATQNKAQFLPVTSSTTDNEVVYAWLDAASTIRILVLNKDESAAGTVTVTLPGGYGSGTVTRLLEKMPNATPSYLSTAGVTLGGQTFDGSSDGTIQGTTANETVTPSGSAYSIAMPIVSAALITVPHN